MLGFLATFIPVMFIYTYTFMQYFVKFAWYGIATFLVISIIVPSMSFWGGVSDATSFFMQVIPEYLFMFFVTISEMIDYTRDMPTALQWVLGLSSFAIGVFGLLITATYYVSFVLVTVTSFNEWIEDIDKKQQKEARAGMTPEELHADNHRLQAERAADRAAPRYDPSEGDPNDEMLMYGMTTWDDVKEANVQANAIASALRKG